MLDGLGPDTAGCGDVVALGLTSTHWCVRPDPGASACPLVDGTRSWGLWLQGSGGPRTGIGPLMGRAKSQRVLGLVPTDWWVESGPKVSGYRALGVLGLVFSACWWAGLGLRGSEGWCLHIGV